MNREIHNDAIQLLQQLIAIPSFSKEEHGTALLLQNYLQQKGITPQRLMNNVWATNTHFNPKHPTLLLNSHHDTVKPNSGYTREPFQPTLSDGRIYGLGSNDAGGCLVALLAAFLAFHDRTDLKYNLVFAASAEEEISGPNGIESLLNVLPPIDCAIVGEPTGMQMAVAEKGLLVIDCTTHGVAGHAAREEGQNALYKALEDIQWFRTFTFPKSSELLGPVKMSVTMINSGVQHNIVPNRCTFTVDIRLNDCYTHDEVLDIIAQHVSCEVSARSKRLKSTSISADHPLVMAGNKAGAKPFGSSTMSDKALMAFPALKIGPGESARSHMADEYILLSEVASGIDTYINLLNNLL